MTRPTCLITGGSSGIGLATAQRFATEGYWVAICGRGADRLRQAKMSIDEAASAAGHEADCRTFVADIGDISQVHDLVETTLGRFGKINVLVNNAAVAPLAKFEVLDNAVVDETIDVNIRGTFYLTQAVWKSMMSISDSDRKSTIVNISSLSAVDPFPGFSLYGACKAWLDLMTQSLAVEGGALGIRVCSIRPGAVETPLLRGLFPEFPAEQCVSPADVAKVVWGCVQDPQQYPSGEAFTVTRQSDHGIAEDSPS